MNTSAESPPVSPTSSALRSWVPVAGAAALWWLLYSLNRRFWDWVLFDVIGIDADSRLGELIHFFFYDVTKITLLLTGIIFVVTVLRSFMSVERTRYLLVGIGLGAIIHGWVPEQWFADHAVGPFGVPIAVGLGVPLYSNEAGVMATPALVINDEVVLTGHVPSSDEVKQLLAAR